MKDGWEVRPLGEVAEVIAGQSPPGSAYNKSGEGLPFYQGKKDFAERYLSPPAVWTTHVTKRAEPGDILMSVRAPVGPINEAVEPICIGRGLAAIRANGAFVDDYLWYGLLALQPEIAGTDGAVFASINRNQIAALPIPLPPLEEQRRIVAVLDEAFEGLARARANIEANLADAEELRIATRDAIFNAYARNISRKPLKEFVSKITYGFTNPMPDADDGPWKVTAKNVVGGSIDYNTTRRTTQEAFDTLLTDKSRPKVGDVLITKDGTLGRTAVVDCPDICINQSVAVISPTEEVQPNYLSELLATSEMHEALITDAGGTTVKHLYITRIPNIEVAIPTKEAQAHAIDEWHAAKRDLAVLSSKISVQLADLATLRQSLLVRAFRGELT